MVFKFFKERPYFFIFKLTQPIYIYIYIYIYIINDEMVNKWVLTPQLHHTPVSTPTEALRKDALSENQITEGASDISRAGTKGGHPRAVLPPKELLCPPLSFLSPPLLNVIDFESETDKTVHIRKRLRASATARDHRLHAPHPNPLPSTHNMTDPPPLNRWVFVKCEPKSSQLKEPKT